MNEYLDKNGRELKSGQKVHYYFDGYERISEIIFDPWYGVSVGGIRGFFRPEDLEIIVDDKEKEE